jgi:sigma-B regulation protein RsbU (phosphoserine phosphatase)
MASTDPENLLAIIPCGIFTFSQDGSVQFINQPLLDKLGFALEEIQGKSVETILTLSSRIFYQTHLFPLLKLHKKADEIYLTLQTKIKEAVPVLLNAVQQVVDGESTNICSCITVYERRKYEDEILKAKHVAEDALNRNEELQKVKNELEKDKEQLDQQLTTLRNRNRELAQLNDLFTHDLQEPVRKVAMFSDIIINDKAYLLKGDRDYVFNIIHRSTRKIQLLLRAVQTYLHLNADEMETQPVNLKNIVEHQFEVAKQLNPGVEACLTLEDLPVINGNASQLETLVKELLQNAFTYKREEPLEIEVSSTIIEDNVFNNTQGKYKYGEFIRLTIRDNGIGIDDQSREHIFKILKKINGGSERMGIGLALCKKIAENHAGTITAESVKNNGAKFVVTLPFN